MPGPIAHHFTARWVAENLITRRSIPADTLSGFSPFLHFGSQGPDFLFFNTRDWPIGSEASDTIKFVIDIYGTLNEIKETIRDFLPLEEIDRLIEAGREESTVVRQIVDLMRATDAVRSVGEATILTAVQGFLAKNFGSLLFNEVIGHPEQRVSDRYQVKGNWWWFDTLHYKRTGQYTQTLLRNARASGRTDEIAYALGYLTHFAADTVGHPYINILSGGPYRTHSQRHKVIENYHDTFLYRRYVPGGELPQSNLYDQYVLSGSKANPDLPPNIADLIIRTMREVYPDAPRPRYGQVPDASDLQAAYHLWYEWFKMATTVLDGLRPPEPYRLTDELADAWRRFEREMSETLDSLSRPFRGGFSITAIFEFLAALVLGLFEVVKDFLDFLLGSALAIGLSPLRAGLSVIYEGLYNMFMTFYEMVALAGLAFPFNNMTNRRTIRHFFNPNRPEFPDANFNFASSYAPLMYPLKTFNPSFWDTESHLVYPFPAGDFIENNRANIGPEEYMVNNPVFYLENAGMTVPATYAFLRDLPGSRLNELLAQRFTLNNTLGSARQFSLFLFGEFNAGRNIPNFNLDGDKGYGFKSWRLRASTREMPGREDDFPRINQIQENPDNHALDSLLNIL